MGENKSLKTNTILNVTKTIFSIIFPLITFPYISRVLMPENVGKFNFGASFVSYFSLIAILGITTYAIRECSTSKDNKERLSTVASEIFSINICTTVVAYILLALSLILFRRLDPYRELIIIQSTAILFTTLGADWLNSAMEDFAFITFRTIGFQILSLVLMFIFVREPDDYIKYAIITVISSSGANIVNVVYRQKFCSVRFIKNMNFCKHIRSILFLFVMILAQTVFLNADITMLGLMKGDFEVGIYSTAVKISNLLSQVVASILWVVLPRLSLYFEEENYNNINELLKKILCVLMLVGIPIIAGTCVISEEIILIIGGPQYSGATIPLIILMARFGFSLIGEYFLGNMVLLPSKQEKKYMSICCITAIVNVILNYVFIPMGGVIAAAVTSAFSAFLIMILLLIEKDKRIKISYIINVVKYPLIGAILIIAFCIFIKTIIHSLFIKTIICIGGSVIIYSLVLIFSKDDFVLENITAIKNKFIRRKIKERD